MTPRPWLLIGALALGLGACRDPDPSAEADAAPSAGEAPAAAPFDRRDPGPQLERPVGEKPSLSRPDVVLEVDALETVDGAVYLRALVPQDPRQVVGGPLYNVRIDVLGERHGVAVPAGEGRLPDRAWIYVRLVGEDPPPDPLEVRWYQAALLDGEPGQVQTLSLVGAARARPFSRLSTRMHHAAGRWFGSHPLGPPTDFHAFADGRMAVWGADPVERARLTEPLDLLALGGAPTRLLMRDRGQRLSAVESGTVPLADIEPPPTVGSPWDALTPKAAPPPDPLAGWAPAEWIYLRLSGVSAGLALHDEATTLFGPAVAALTNVPRGQRLLDRLLDGLALDRPALEALGRATGAAAVLLTDPLLAEGPGMVALLTVKDDAAVAAALEAGIGEGRAVDRITVAGRMVERVRSPRSTALRVVSDGVLMLANSRAAIERVFEARAGTRPLTADPSYPALRARLGGAAEPVLFAMAGEAHLAYLASPAFRLAAGRRSRALVDLRAVDFAGLLHGWLAGRPFDYATGRAALIASGLLTGFDLTHDDGGRIDLERGRPCSAWGCVGAGRPLIDVALQAVSATEAGAYARLRAEGLDRWRERVAPLAVRVEQRPGGYVLSGQMLPLPRHHAWLDVARNLGARTAPTAAIDGVIELRAAVAADAPLKAQLAAWLTEATAQRDVGLDWLGEHVVLGIAERSGIWDGVLNVMELPNTAGRRIWRATGQRKQVLDRLPVYLLAPIADRAALDRALTGARVFAQGPGSPIGWTELGSYRGVSVIELREVLSEAPERVGIYLGVAGETLVVGVERASFEAAIDRVLDGGKDGGTAAPTAQETGGPAQMVLRLAPTAGGWLERALIGAVERFAVDGITRARMAFEAVARGTTLPEPGPARDAALLRWLGHVPTGPHGDRPQMSEVGEAALPRYGSATAPRWPALPVKGDPLTTLKSLDARFGFDGPPGRTAVMVELAWRRR